MIFSMLTSTESLVRLFLKVFKFLDNFGFNSSNIDMIKLNKVIKTTEFEKMKELEKKKTFIESQIHPETGKRIPFFNLGSKNDWRKDLDEEIRKNIEGNEEETRNFERGKK